MHPGPPSSFALFVRHLSAGRRSTLLAPLAGLLAAALPWPASAAPNGAVMFRPNPVYTGRPPIPYNPGNLGRLPGPNLSDLSTQSQLQRLSVPSARSYDIVPPANLARTASGPLPGYQVVRLGRGHNNRLCFVATVAGTRGLMMVDTGASNSSLSNTTYRSLLFNSVYKLPARLPRSVNLNGLTIPLAQAPDFQVGKNNLGAVPVCLIPSRYLTEPASTDTKERVYDGLTGQNILRHYNAIVDCGRLVMYLNLDPAKKANLAASFARGGWTRVPLAEAGNDFTVPCVLNGHAFRLVVDTAAPFTNLNRDFLGSAQVPSHDLRAQGGLIGTTPEKLGLVDVDRLQIGGYTATGVHMTTTSQSMEAFDRRHAAAAEGPIAGLLGGDILASNGAVIDMGGRALYLKRPAGKNGKRP